MAEKQNLGLIDKISILTTWIFCDHLFNNLGTSIIDLDWPALMVFITTDYISVGANRHPAAADWDKQLDVLAFGADNNVALWSPRVYAMLPIISTLFMTLTE